MVSIQNLDDTRGDKPASLSSPPNAKSLPARRWSGNECYHIRVAGVTSGRGNVVTSGRGYEWMELQVAGVTREISRSEGMCSARMCTVIHHHQ